LTSRYGLGPRVSARVALHGGRMRIVCSIDESTAARDAAESAGQLARRMRAELVYVHSVTGESSERLGARSHRRCDLLFVGYTPRARFASALLGEAHRRLVRDAACPVMLVPAGARLRAGTGIVLGYNLPSISSAAAVAAGRLAAALDSSLVVTHVEAAGAPGRAMGAQLHDAARRLSQEAVAAAGRNLEVEHVERTGDPSEQLAVLAAGHDAAVIVIGSPRTSWRSMLSRSVATRLQNHARHPVLVLPRRAALPAG
jgi:nucleotide-binding universal stress UspA family protein